MGRSKVSNVVANSGERTWHAVPLMRPAGMTLRLRECAFPAPRREVLLRRGEFDPEFDPLLLRSQEKTHRYGRTCLKGDGIPKVMKEAAFPSVALTCHHFVAKPK